MERKRVLFVLPNISGGGAERVTLTFLRYLNRDRFDPSLLLIKREGDYWDEVPRDLRVYHLLENHEKVKTHLPKVLKKILPICKKNDVIVGSLEMTATYLAYIGGKFTKKPVVGWVHSILSRLYFSTPRNGLSRLVCAYMYPRLSKIICVSRGVAENLVDLFPRVRSEQIVILYNPVAIDKIGPFLGDNDPLLDTKENKNNIILSVGRLSYQKGFDVLIKAYALLRRNGFHNLFLWIVGKGEEEENLKQLTRKLGVENGVQFLGFQAEPWKFMKKADVFALSSRCEGFSVVLVEAMLCGLPVVSTDCPYGPREVLLNGACGLLVPPEDPEALAKALKQVLLDKVLSNQLVQAGFARAQDFLPERIVPQLEKILLEL